MGGSQCADTRKKEEDVGDYEERRLMEGTVGCPPVAEPQSAVAVR